MKLENLIRLKWRYQSAMNSTKNPNDSKELERKLRNVEIYINHEGNSVSDDALSPTNPSK